MVTRMTKTASAIRDIISVFCSSAGIVLLLFGGILFVKPGSASAGFGTACQEKAVGSCRGGLCSIGTCGTTSGKEHCACLQ
jgi:hypothetical protein